MIKKVDFFLEFLFFSSFSGGGFFVKARGLWTLRGIVSSGAFHSGYIGCDTNGYALYTKLTDFVDWIRKSVERN